MATSPHRIHHDLYRGPKILRDPGDGGTITPSADLQICEMTSSASNETRTLANPTKPGIRFVLRLLTDGGGDIVVIASNGYNVQLETAATFADAGDMISLVSVSLTATTYRWQILENVGTGIATASASSTGTSTSTTTPTTTSTTTSTATSTGSSTSTQSISGSDTASGTFSATTTKSSTETTTPTTTSTTTATTTSTGTSTSTPSATGTQ